MPHERVPVDDPIRAIWTRFEVLASVHGARQHLQRRAEHAGVALDPDLLDEKAQGLAFTIRTAGEYFRVKPEGNLTLASVAYYYGALNLLEALLVSEPENEATLADLERLTNQGGHGLKSIVDSCAAFPDGERVCLREQGFLPEYLRRMAYPLGDVLVRRNFSDFARVPAEERHKFVPIKDLIGRIPDVRNIYVEIFREQPQYLAIDHVRTFNRGPDGERMDELVFPLLHNSEYLTADFVRAALDLPADVELVEEEGSLRTTVGTGRIRLLEDANRYASVLAHDCHVRPLLGIDDVLIFDFMLLYTLSIWVRYRPELWREISEGALDMYRPLVLALLAAVERTLPNIVLNRLYEREILFAPFAYMS